MSGDKSEWLTMNTFTLLKRASAVISIAFSFAALTMVLVHVAIFGTAREVDEGIAAHLWQLFMLSQAPVAAFFAIKWLPQTPVKALQVLALQMAAAIAALAPVFFLGL